MLSTSTLPSGTTFDVRIVQPMAIRLTDRRGGSLLFTANRVFTIEGSPSNGANGMPVVTTSMYSYRLLDRLEHELLVYHWQPGPSYVGPDDPHLHVSASLRAATSVVDEREIGLDRLHLPTGQVTLTSVVRSLLTEFGVEPLRPDWSRVLDEAGTGELATSGLTG